jgi:RNA polymerase sigma factor (sigma-70 family)
MTSIPADRSFWNGVLEQIRRRTNDRYNAEDLLHSAYLRLERYRTQHEVDNTAGFLTRTAVNIAVDNHRHDRMLRRHAFEVAQSTQYQSPLQDEVLEGHDRLERLKAGLEQLPPRTRAAFLLHRLSGLKYREIAERLGISQSAVEKHISKAALHLAGWMEGW